MSIEKENKKHLFVFYELLNQKMFDKLGELVKPEFVSHRPTGDINRDELLSGTEQLYSSFPDLNIVISHLVAEGDMIAYREIMKGTHEGEFMGIAPTGKKIEVVNTCILKMIDGKWAEAWPTIDLMGLLQPIGAITMT